MGLLLLLIILLSIINDSSSYFVAPPSLSRIIHHHHHHHTRRCHTTTKITTSLHHDTNVYNQNSRSLLLLNMYDDNNDNDRIIPEMKEQQQQQQQRRIPKLVVFDLDGCLWYPEMYQLYYDNGPPFRSMMIKDDDDDDDDTDNNNNNGNILLTRKGTEIKLLGDVRKVMQDLYCNPKWKNCLVGISSRTDQPDWARELLTKFQITNNNNNKNDENNNKNNKNDDKDFCFVVLQDIFDRNGGGPIEISYDSKVQHFERIAKKFNIKYEDMLFLDNEYWNCQEVSQLGVTVGYCPYGVTLEIWNAAINAFPTNQAGDVVEL